MQPVTIHTTRGCWHCHRAKRLLRRKGAAVTEIKSGARRDAARAELAALYGASTFPQIVIGKRHIGGADELVALERIGELDGLLAGATPQRLSRTTSALAGDRQRRTP